MSTSAQNGGGIEYWLKEEMGLWHVIPIFFGLAVAGMAFAHGVGFVMGLDGAAVSQFATEMIGGAGLFAGGLMGWTARRYQEEGRI